MTRTRRGFTLLELILATSIMAMIALTLYSCMATAFRARTQAVDQTRGPRQAAVILELIAADLQSVVKPGTALGKSFTGYAMGSASAPADSLSFVCMGADDATSQTPGTATPDIDPAADGPRGVTLLLRTEGDSARLIRQVQRRLLASALPEPDEEILAQGVRGLSIRYYSDNGWASEWDSDTAGGLPLAVELTITFDAPVAGDPSRTYTASKLVPLSLGGVTAAAAGTP